MVSAFLIGYYGFFACRQLLLIDYFMNINFCIFNTGFGLSIQKNLAGYDLKQTPPLLRFTNTAFFIKNIAVNHA
jgi:hypothetical protein